MGYTGDMSKRQWLIILGLFIALFDVYAGFPADSLWGKAVGVIVGLLVALVAYKLKPEPSQKVPGEVPYVEHKDIQP